MTETPRRYSLSDLTMVADRLRQMSSDALEIAEAEAEGTVDRLTFQFASRAMIDMAERIVASIEEEIEAVRIDNQTPPKGDLN